MKLIERKVGEIYYSNHLHKFVKIIASPYGVIGSISEERCILCSYGTASLGCRTESGGCSHLFRSDNRSVIFKEMHSSLFLFRIKRYKDRNKNV